ncbi:MAG TPA: tetratricopeptide repeat protein [Sandaracinaceae bacterium LLY-WYZ-13_1]|nr:tetratricopeptide repeat protein [Sandaracinaceae bacterium LLY-WYZ-13_1]
MRDGVRPGAGRRRLLVREDEPPANEDFLFHLSRGSELLTQDRVVEAKEELERALEFRPRDAQSQDLLAGVYFRLGVYPTAIRLWQALLDDFEDDVTLHVNLGLAFFKTGQPDDAKRHLEAAIELEPEHARAWGYLGLVLWRQAKLDEAREAFLQGGQQSMARRMEEMSSAGSIPAPAAEEAPEPEDADPTADDAQVSAMRDAAGAAEQRFSDPGVKLSVEPGRGPRRRRTTGQWSVVETGADPVPRTRRPSRSVAALTPPRLGAVVQSWSVELPDDTPLSVGPEGELLIQASGAVHGRLSGLRAVRGALSTEAVHRRFRGRSPEEVLGGTTDPIARWHGPVAAVVAAPERQRYHAVRVSGSLLYVREELVQAFDDRVGYESGRLPMAGEPVVLLSFHGEGTVVLRLPRRPSGLEVRADEEVRVDPNALVGWTGRLFPTEIERPDPASVPLAFRGQGTLLVT